ncbi:patatin-like phospholipase family protein [Salisediminibacterium beveridgei]|uniref:PNPLA domain-containing protein n=1 Tax=Salisediminibacterium beveridgei TaxID=632773 RepID=A0A1D7QX69_9BACI|nr:patatin-like phospholipase family protein [Salisediminibacterium beveridgei]AOM83605.1 hypothetical protein BBEV_2247 [Salisediminibacterium beveridgei]
MNGFNLAFSGGGFRAAFFCLGAYRRLVQLGIHDQAKMISTVSGGSITAAVIMKELSKGPFHDLHDFDARVKTPMKEFGSKGFRNKVIRHAILPPRWPFWPVLPRSRFSRHAPITLEKTLLSKLLMDGESRNGLMMDQLPPHPVWICNATNLHTLKRISFSRTKIRDEVFGDSRDVSDISIAQVVAASAAFPLLFDPINLNVKDRSFDKTKKQYSFFRLTDGGVYDNLGSEEFLTKTDKQLKNPEPYMIFDASARRKPWSSDKRVTWTERQLRVLSVSMDQVAELRKKLIRKHDSKGVQLLNVETINENKWFQTNYWQHYFKLKGVNRHLDLPSYPDDYADIERMLADVRTDLDKFSEIEMEMLMWAGALRADLGSKVLFSAEEFDKMPLKVPRHEVPDIADYNPGNLNLEAIRNGLKNSHKRRIIR